MNKSSWRAFVVTNQSAILAAPEMAAQNNEFMAIGIFIILDSLKLLPSVSLTLINNAI